MRLLIIDPPGLALDLAWRAKQAGHQVKHCIRDTPKTEHIGKGMVDVIRDASLYYRWADLIFSADNTRWLREMDAARKAPDCAPIIGPSEEMAQWEHDRGVGQTVLKKHGIATIPSVTFSNYDKAIAFVKKNPRRWVSKPNGEAGANNKALSYCSESAADMVYMLEKWKKLGKSYEFLLQEFIPGIEMGVGGWFGPNGWVGGWEENWEFKKLMDGDKGVATGEQGTVLRYVTRSKLAKKVLLPLTDTLLAKKYIGNVDVNCIIDDKGNVWPLEFTMRAGWPAYNIQQELHEGDPVEWLMKLVGGEQPGVTIDKIAIGVCLTVPDYPYSHLTRKEVIGAPIYGLENNRLQPHVHFCEVMWGEAPCDRDGKISTQPCVVTAGDYVLVVSATGDTVYEAKQTCYRRLKQISLPNSPMYRTDIGDRLAKQLPKLQEHGFALNMRFSD
jgi:phosphoribosylamine--glycine ligase